jgi:hypothetical protein
MVNRLSNCPKRGESKQLKVVRPSYRKSVPLSKAKGEWYTGVTAKRNT